jgi:hypothetical protein
MPDGEESPVRPPAPAAEESATAPRPEKLGKKDQAAVDARTAADGTEWGDLLPKPGTPLQ